MAKNMELNIVMSAAVAGALTGMAQVANAMKNTAKSAEELGKKAKELEKAQRALEKVEKLKNAYVNVSKEYLNAARKLHELKEAYNKTGQSNTELAKKIKEQEKVVNSLNKQKERQKHVFEAARSAIEGENQSLGSYKSQLTKVNSELEKMNKLKEAQKRYEARQENIGKVKEFGDRTFNRGIATAGALAVPMKVYMDVEESQADLRKMLGDEAKKYYADIRKISENSPLSQPELYEIAGSLAQSGIVGDQIVEYTNKAQQLKVAFDMSTQEAGQFLAKTKEQLGLTKKEVFSFADTINYMSDNTASVAAQLVDFSQRVGSVARTANVSKEANIALGATLIATGTEANVAATGIKQLYLELGKGADTKKKANAFKFLGINGETLAHDMARDAEGTILKVLEKIKSSHAGDKIGLLTDIFGEHAANSIATLANDTDKLRENLSKAKSEMANGAVEREYAERMKTLGTQLKIAKNQMMNVLADLGMALAPTIKSAVEALTPMIKKVAEWIRQNPKLASGIMKAVAGFAVLSIGIGGATKVFSPLFSAISKGILIFDKFKVAGNFADGFKTAFPVLSKIGATLKPLGKAGFNGLVSGIKAGGSAFKTMLNPINMVKLAFNGLKLGGSSAIKIFKLMLNPFKMLRGAIGIIKSVGIAIKMAFLANPVGVIIGAIVGLIAIFVILYNKSTWFRNGVNNAMKQIMPHVKELGRTIKQGIGQAITWVSNKMKQAGPHMRNVWNSLKPVLSVIGTIIKVVIIVAIRLAISAVRALGSTFKFLSTVAGGVFKMISSAIKTAIAVWKGVFSLFIAFFTGKWNEIPGIISGVWASVKSGISGFVEGAKSILSGLFNWFGEQWNNIKKTAGELGSALNPMNWGKKWTGTNYWEGGLTTVAERGAELVQIPGKPVFLAESEMLLNLPKGTRILNNSQTRSTLRDKVANLKDRVSNLKGGNSYGGNNYSIVINVNGGNPSEVERIVRKVIAGDINKRERTAFG
jgi:phage tail tape measure protein, TP901 family|nr:MAG TPA: minor tail protein [Caudoviricetes sp.]